MLGKKRERCTYLLIGGQTNTILIVLYYGMVYIISNWELRLKNIFIIISSILQKEKEHF